MRIGPPYAAGLSDFYARLSPESRLSSFLSCANQSEQDLVSAFTERGGDGFVGILHEPGPNDGAVVAHAPVHPDGQDGAEVAFAVAYEFQGRGIGMALMDVVVQHARRLGVRRLTAILFTENTPMRWLLHGAGLAILSDSIHRGVEEITLGVGGRWRATPDLSTPSLAAVTV